MMTPYQITKSKLYAYAEWVKQRLGDDKHGVNAEINIKAHELSKEFDLSEYKTDLLHKYASELHPWK